MNHQVYLGLGSNLGDREANINEAIRLIGERVGTVVSQSSLIETEPWGFESSNFFLNGAVLVETSLSPREVLQTTQEIEKALGRKSKTTTHHPSLTTHHSYNDRPIDIDILLFDDQAIDEPDLKIPHPLMYKRDFVMIPLHEICPTIPQEQ